MWKEDDASKGLGMKIVEVKPGYAMLTMTVQPHMVNGERIAHGGFIFLLADSTFAFACNCAIERAVAAQCDVAFIRPASSATCWSRPRGKFRAGPVRNLRCARHRGRCRDRGVRGHSCTIAGRGCRVRRRGHTKIARRETVMAMARMKSSGSGYSAELDEAERASRDEIMALQTKRLAWSLACLRQRRALRKAFDAAGVHPSDFRQLSDLAKFPFTVKTDLATTIPSRCSPSLAKSWSASMRPRARPASRSWSDIPRAISTSGRT